MLESHCYCSVVENRRPVLVHGHRGARAVYAENTLAGFRYAIAAGVDAIEMDVAVTRDDVPVISHGPRLRHCGAIRSLNLADLRRAAPGIPTLGEILALAPRRDFLFNIELKSFPKRPQYAPPPACFAEIALAAIRRAGVERRVLIQSFDFRVLHAMQALAPAIPRAALFALRNESFLSVARRADVRTVSPEFHLVTAKKVQAARDAGIEVLTWTPNRPRQWKRLVEAGVAAIITDDPAALIAYLAANPA